MPLAAEKARQVPALPCVDPDLLRRLVGPTHVDTLVASHGGMHLLPHFKSARVGELGSSFPGCTRARCDRRRGRKPSASAATALIPQACTEHSCDPVPVVSQARG